MYLIEHIPFDWHTCGCLRTNLRDLCPLFTFPQMLGIELMLSGLYNKCFDPISHLTSLKNLA